MSATKLPPGNDAVLTLQQPDGSYLAGQCDANGNLLTAGGSSAGSVAGSTVTLDASVTSGNAAGTVAGTAVTGISAFKSLMIVATLVGNTGGTLDVYLQHSPDGGVTWYDYAHFATVGAAAASAVFCYVPALTNLVTTIGIGTLGAPAPLLAANTFVGGHPFDSLRAVAVGNVGTSLGNAQTIKVIGILQ
jgi:hypothetical protein